MDGRSTDTPEQPLTYGQTVAIDDEPIVDPRHAGSSKEDSDAVGRFLDDAAKSTEKFDLRSGFYVDEEHEAPHSRRDDDDYSRRHRSGTFPHVRHQYSPTMPKKGGRRPSQATAKETPATVPDISEEPSTSEQPLAEQPTPPLLTLTDENADSQPLFMIGEPSTSSLGGASEDPSESTKPERDDDSGVESQKNRADDHSRPSFYQELAGDMRNPTVSQSASQTKGLNTNKQPTSRVKFQLGDDDENSKKSTDELDNKEKDGEPDRLAPPKTGSGRSHHKHRHHHHHHHHHPHKRPSEKDLAMRRQIGSEIQLEMFDDPEGIDLDQEAGPLAEFDKEDIASHRFADPMGMHKRKVSKKSMTSIVHIGKSDKVKRKQIMPLLKKKQKFDHSPHELFVELDELYFEEHDQEWAWEEKARWIKFEEDVEEGSDRWGKPHVASLSFHSLLELRRCIEQGAIMLDVEAEELPAIASQIVDQLVITDQLNAEDKGKILNALLLKHKHVNEHRGILRRNTSFTNLMNMGEKRRRFSLGGHKPQGSDKKTPLPSDDEDPPRKHVRIEIPESNGIDVKEPPKVSFEPLIDKNDGNVSPVSRSMSVSVDMPSTHNKFIPDSGTKGKIKKEKSTDCDSA